MGSSDVTGGGEKKPGNNQDEADTIRYLARFERLTFEWASLRQYFNIIYTWESMRIVHVIQLHKNRLV